MTNRASRLRRGVLRLICVSLFACGVSATATEPASLSVQLTELGRQAETKLRSQFAQAFYRKALELDATNATAKRALEELDKRERVVDAPENPERLMRIRRLQLTADIEEQLQFARDLEQGGEFGAAVDSLRLAASVVNYAEGVDDQIRVALRRRVQAQVLSTVRHKQRVADEKRGSAPGAASREIGHENSSLTVTDVGPRAPGAQHRELPDCPDSELWRILAERRTFAGNKMRALVDRDAKTRSILRKLEEPVSMPFADGASLEDVLTYIKTATDRANGSKIPIYVDPVSLQEVETTMTSLVWLDLDGVPLKDTLRLMLKQLGLDYVVKDGLLLVTSEADVADLWDNGIPRPFDVEVVPVSLVGSSDSDQMRLGDVQVSPHLDFGLAGLRGAQGMMSLPPSDSGQGESSSGFLEKKKQLQGLNPGAKPAGRNVTGAGGATDASGRPRAPGRDDPPTVRPRPKPAPKNLIEVKPDNRPIKLSKTNDRRKFWKDYYANHKNDDEEDAIKRLREDLRFYNLNRKTDHVEACVTEFMLARPELVAPWMYIALALALKENKRPDSDFRLAMKYAADTAERSKNPNHLVNAGDFLFENGDYERAGQLIDQAAALVPHQAVPFIMSINLSLKTKDPKRMADAVEKLLSLGWPGQDERIRRDAHRMVERLAKDLRENGREKEADELLAKLPEIEARDLFIRLTWTGRAGLDLKVDEPLGATASFLIPRTVFGGAMVKSGHGTSPEDVYVCPRGFDGDYKIRIDTFFNDPQKPATTATLEVITHEGTPEEHKETHKVVLGSKPAAPIVVTLKGGRRKTVMPFLAPPKPEPKKREEKSQATQRAGAKR